MENGRLGKRLIVVTLVPRDHPFRSIHSEMGQASDALLMAFLPVGFRPIALNPTGRPRYGATGSKVFAGDGRALGVGTFKSER